MLTGKTALCRHSDSSSHDFDLENAEIIAYEDNYEKGRIREVTEITKNKKFVNFKTDPYTLRILVLSLAVGLDDSCCTLLAIYFLA